jgi:protocatechuate 4,5-dioxygenase beta chain
MPLAGAYALSHSPVLYRPPERWPKLHAYLTGDIVQPAAFHDETAEMLEAYALRIDAAFAALADAVGTARLDALVVLVADRARAFDETNTPQLHVYAGDSIWGDAALAELGEAPQPQTFACDAQLGAILAEELANAGFDVAESRGAFRPVGDPERGASAALIEPLTRLFAGSAVPIVPIHINCYVDPCVSGHRMAPFGTALANALALVPERVGILASGGLSGDAGGPLAGWIDDVLDRWVLRRIVTRRAADLGGIFDVESMTLRGSAREIRLWAAAGCAAERAGATPRVIDYLPIHHAAAGAAFLHWEG